jgi:glycosyltransferase involved in cell wall biosynthesis
LHITHFIQRYPPALGGSEAYIARLARHLSDLGHTQTIWTTTAVDLSAFWSRRATELPATATEAAELPATTPADSAPDAGGGRVRVRRFRPWRWPARRYWLKALSLVPVRPWQAATLPCNPFCPAMWRAAGQYRAEPVDLVHASAFPYAFPILCGLRLARRCGVPFWLTPFLHLGDPDRPTDRIRRRYLAKPLVWLLHQADRVFVQTPSEWAAVVGVGVPAQRVVLQGLGVEPDECTGGDRARARAAWGIPAGAMVVGHLANLSEEKGSVDLLHAWAQLARAGAGQLVELVLAGPAMPNFERAWARLPAALRQRVRRLGPLTDGQRRDFYAGIDTFALPSRSDSFGLVLLEAWANARPTVVYRAGGPADLVRDGRDGLVVPCGDQDGLAAALLRLAENPEERWAMGWRGQARALAEFRWEDRLARFSSLLGPERHHHVRVGRQVRPFEQVDTVRHGWEDGQQALADGSRLAG